MEEKTEVQQKENSNKITINIPEPSPKQALFLQDKHRHVGYGGARGGGKSWAVRVKAVLLCLKWPGIKVLIVRRTYPELTNNHIDPLKEMLPTEVAKYNNTDKQFKFRNGSTIKFGYCNCEKDLHQYQGAQYDVVFIDEATQLDEEWIKKINLVVREPNGLPKRTYYTMNPGGVSHAYFKRIFIDGKFEGKEKAENYNFTKALVTDNRALMKENPEYLEELEALPKKLRQAWLEGRWDIFDGQFFEEFRLSPDLFAAHDHGCDEDADTLLQQRRWTHVIPDFDISRGEARGWNIIRSYDFGYGKPFSCAWWAVDYEGTLYRILEWYGWNKTPNEGAKLTPDQQFARIAEIEREHPWLKGRRITGVADPAIFDASRGESIAETAEHYRVYFEPGDNERIAGWMQCHYRLQFDENGYPRMYVFESCKAFIRTIPMMLYDETKVEDMDTRLEDHVADEWRYTCMSRPIKPILQEIKKIPETDPLDQYRRK